MLKLVKNRCYHVDGWKAGTQFRLLDWDDSYATIQRPLRRGKKWRVPLTKLRNTKRHGANKEPYIPQLLGSKGGSDDMTKKFKAICPDCGFKLTAGEAGIQQQIVRSV